MARRWFTGRGLWDHHYRKAPPGTMEFSGSLNRWSGHGNKEFRTNLSKAFAAKSKIRLIIVIKTDEIARVEAGEAPLVNEGF